MRNFRNLNIWQSGLILVKEIYQLSSNFPMHERYYLQSQMRRAAVSVSSNIAEGAGRSSEIEYKRFLEIAMGSSFELKTQLLITQELELFSGNKFNQLLSS